MSAQKPEKADADLFARVTVREEQDGVSFSVKVHPRAKREGIGGELGGALKLSLTAPAVDDRANQACADFFARLLHVPRSAVVIVKGAHSRSKTIRIGGVTAAQFQVQLKKQ